MREVGRHTPARQRIARDRKVSLPEKGSRSLQNSDLLSIESLPTYSVSIPFEWSRFNRKFGSDVTIVVRVGEADIDPIVGADSRANPWPYGSAKDGFA